ncbi:MAG: CheR family methyltransferase [Candidatus Binatia bacterium]
MTHGLSDQLLSQLSEFVADHIGLHFSRERWRDLERGLRSATREFGASDVESCAQGLLSASLTKQQIEILASHLTVGETYFFREKSSFAILEDHILPELIRIRRGAERHLRIWSAGCCTGEEPYSIAILLDRVLPAPRQWRVTILATDVNPRFLQKAAAGVFGDWSFRNAPPWLKERYFTPVSAHRFAILPRIKELVRFTYLNLAEDMYPSLTSNTNAMDLIFCRNVLMYFAADRAQAVIRNFHRSLVDGGWLSVSPTETSTQLFSPFTPIHFEGAIFYKKESKPPPALMDRPQEKSPARARNKEARGLPPSTHPSPFLMPVPPLQVLPRQSKGEPVAHTTEASQTTSSALLARRCANLGNLSEARQWAEKAIDADKLDAGLHYLHAMILQEQGVREEATVSLKRALYLDPDFVLAYFALGNLALQHRRVKEALKQFTTALSLLQRYRDDEALPLSDGLAAGRLRAMIQSAMAVDHPA